MRRKKKLKVMALLVVAIFLLAACGEKKDTDRDSVKGKLITEEKEEENSQEKEEESQDEIHTISLDLSKSARPEIFKVTLDGNFDDSAYLMNMYQVDVYVSEVAGLVGCPVEVDLGNGKEGILKFYVDESSFQEVPMENMLVLYYEESTQWFEDVEAEIYDNVVECSIKESGTYMLVDRYEWYATWGVVMEEYAHDVTYDDMEYNFKVVIPQEVSFDESSDYWRFDDGFYYGLYRSELARQREEKGEEPALGMQMYAFRFPNETDNLENPRSVVTLDKFLEEVVETYAVTDIDVDGYENRNMKIKHFKLKCGKNAYLLTWDMEVGVVNGVNVQRKYRYYSAYYEYDEETFIQLQYTVDAQTDYTELEEKILKSIYSFKYLE